MRLMSSADKGSSVEHVTKAKPSEAVVMCPGPVFLSEHSQYILCDKQVCHN